MTLARDRFGEKPLYWGWDNLENKKFIFASDISAFRGLETNNFSINKNALSAYFNRGCVPAPFSILNEIQQLLPRISCRDKSKK